jgi:predicted nucleotidyltransferase
MQKLILHHKLERKINDFVQKLKDIYQNNLVSVILYGSLVSGEFIDKHSNLNILVVLENIDPYILKKASNLIRKFYLFQTLFLSPEYIERSTDVFPIEFLDIKENYFLLYGKDIIKDITIDLKNLRFQCEQELKAKLLNLYQLYLKLHKNKIALRSVLLRSFISILHIARNILRLKGKIPVYKKEMILDELYKEFPIGLTVWQKILNIRNKKEKIKKREIESLFVSFIHEVEKLVDIVDRL